MLNTYSRDRVHSVMMNSLFIVNTTGCVLLEKKCKTFKQYEISKQYFVEQIKSGEYENMCPVMFTPQYCLINIYRHQLFFVAAVTKEVQPLIVVEFLKQVADRCVDYFKECSESSINKYCVSIYQVLDEMLDNGFPLATDFCHLREIIKPPDLLTEISDTLTGKIAGFKAGTRVPFHHHSNTQWRDPSVMYANEGIFFDVIEEIHAIIDCTGRTVTAEVQGHIDCLAKLSGYPLVTMTVENAPCNDYSSFHPCIRPRSWEETSRNQFQRRKSKKRLTFIPPDGTLRLLSYFVDYDSLPQPVQVKADICYTEGRFKISVVNNVIEGKTIQSLVLECHLPMTATCELLETTQGAFSVDSKTKALSWTVGRLDAKKSAHIKGKIHFPASCKSLETRPILTLTFNIEKLAMSGTRVVEVDVSKTVTFRPNPGKFVKYLTISGNYEVRT